MARCENCLHFHLCVNMKHQHLRMLLAGDKAECCNYFESKADVATIADTVQEYREGLHKEFASLGAKDKFNKEFFLTKADQIAQEMLEGEK